MPKQVTILVKNIKKTEKKYFKLKECTKSCLKSINWVMYRLIRFFVWKLFENKPLSEWLKIKIQFFDNSTNFWTFSRFVALPSSVFNTIAFLVRVSSYSYEVLFKSSILDNSIKKIKNGKIRKIEILQKIHGAVKFMS